MVYTEDSWATVRRAPAWFGFALGRGDLELWRFAAPLSGGGTTVEFAIAYEVAGQTYWANNNGANYRIDR